MCFLLSSVWWLRDLAVFLRGELDQVDLDIEFAEWVVLVYLGRFAPVG